MTDATSPWQEPLVAAGEFRADWLYGPVGRRRAEGTAAGLGAWGMVTGGAVFLMLVHERHHPWLFLVALAFAALASYLVERVREVLEGHGAARRGSAAVTVLTIAVVEVFVVAVHTAVNPPAEVLDTAREVLFGEGVGTLLPPWVGLAAQSLVWIATGALLALWLMTFAPEARGGPARKALSGARSGLVAGLLVAPFGVLVIGLGLRLVGAVLAVAADPAAFGDHLHGVGKLHWIFGLAVKPLLWLGDHWQTGLWGKIGTVVVSVAVLSRAGKEPAIRAWLGALLLALVLPVLFADLENLFSLVLLTAVVWAVPAAVLGALTPAMRRPAENRTTWGALAFAGAVILTGLTVVRLADPWWLVFSALLLFTGIVVRRGASPREAWPLLALTGALCVAGVSALPPEATFAGILHRLPPPSALLEKRPPELYERLKIPAFPPEFGFGRHVVDPSHWTLTPPSPLFAALLVTETEKAAALRADWDRLVQAASPPTLDALAPVYARAEKGLSWGDPAARATAQGVVDEIAPLADTLERLEEARLEGEERASGADDDGTRLARVRSVLARVRTTPWSTEGAQARAATRAQALASRVAELEAAETKRLADEAKALADEGEKAERGEPSRERRAEALAARVKTAAAERVDKDAKAPLETLAGDLEALRARWRVETRTAGARLLELSLAGSLAFWVGVGLLVGWTHVQRGPRTLAGPDGVVRCSWATPGPRREYHDHVHGTVPVSDRELFRRLSFEIVVHDVFWSRLAHIEKHFHGFDPATVAAMKGPGDTDPMTLWEPCDRRPRPRGAVKKSMPWSGTTLVIANAKTVLAASPGGTGTAILDDLRARASDPQALVARFVEVFRVRRDTPAATFLQSVGLLPGAHADGCTVADTLLTNR